MQMNQILGGNPVAAALQRRGLPLTLLSQQTPGAPGYQPGMTPPSVPTPEMPEMKPMADMAHMPKPQPHITSPGGNPAMDQKLKNEAEIITDALIKRHNALTKREDDKHKFMMQVLQSQLPQQPIGGVPSGQPTV